MTRARLAAACAGAALTGALPLVAAVPPAAGDAAWLRERLATAPAASVIDVPPGEYQGPFVIDRPLHLRGGGRATLRGDGTTHVVVVRAPDVTVEGFGIRASGLDLGQDHAGIHVTGARAVIRRNRFSECLHGVYVREADGVRVEDNTIVGRSSVPAPRDGSAASGTAGAEVRTIPLGENSRGNGVHMWKSSGHVVARNVIRETRDGVYLSFVDHSDVRDNVITHVRYGLHYMYSDFNRFEGNLFRDNAAGAALMFSKGILLRGNQFSGNRGQRAYGLLLQGVDDTRVVENRIEGNTVGLFVENSHGNRVAGNRVAGNHVGVHVSDSSDANTFTGNSFVSNVHAVEASGAGTSNRWAANGRGNYWDGAMRLDLDGNGVADLPHRELDLFGGLRRPFPAIGLLAGSPGERLLRFVHARIAVPGLPGIVDPAPLVREAAR